LVVGNDIKVIFNDIQSSYIWYYQILLLSMKNLRNSSDLMIDILFLFDKFSDVARIYPFIKIFHWDKAVCLTGELAVREREITGNEDSNKALLFDFVAYMTRNFCLYFIHDECILLLSVREWF
jgi:hypothetical protein